MSEESECICECCCDDLTEEIAVKYKDEEKGEWKDCVYCRGCIEIFLETKWKDFMEELTKKADCLVTYRHYAENGPPLNLVDKKAFDCKNGYVHKFFYDGQEQSAQLKDAYVGAERQFLWDAIKEKYEILKNLPDLI